jgi:hypothetical protein
LRALRRLAAICLNEVIESQPFSRLASIGGVGINNPGVSP